MNTRRFLRLVLHRYASGRASETPTPTPTPPPPPAAADAPAAAAKPPTDQQDPPPGDQQQPPQPPEPDEIAAKFCPVKKPGKGEVLERKGIRVSILGADSASGESSAFLLKQNPVVTHLFLYGGPKVVGIGADLRHLDTRCKVSCYQGPQGLPNALRSADIVLLMNQDTNPRSTNGAELLKIEGPRVVEMAEACSRYAPRALVTVCVAPIAATVPLVAAVYRRTEWYHPGRLIGCVAHSQILANSIVARFQELDPTSVHVPLVGGPDLDCVVPLFSRAEPVPLVARDCEVMVARFRSRAEDSNPLKPPKEVRFNESSPHSEAFAINRMVTTMGMGMCGDEEAICTAFVRNNAVSACRHLVTLVRFGATRIVHSFGIPKLTKLEMEMFHQATMMLKKRDQEAYDFLSSTDTPAGAHMMSNRAARRAEHAN